MAKILVTCSCCAEDISFRPSEVSSRICVDNGAAEYRFTCPHCDTIVVKQTSAHMLERLDATGVEIELWSLPAELHERHTGPRLTHEDLLDFHISLSDDESVSEAIDGLVI